MLLCVCFLVHILSASLDPYLSHPILFRISMSTCVTFKLHAVDCFLQDILMDHALRTISYIADIGDLVVLMARRMSQSASEEECSSERYV